MKIYTGASARGYTTQISRIEQGFIELGCEITPHPQEANLVFQNNAWFDQIIDDKKAGNFRSGTKFIFNILDICPHCQDFPMEKLREQIKWADAVTVISDTVKQDCLTRLDNLVNYHIIYNPQMSVRKMDGLKKHPYKYLYVGRACDLNKRSYLALNALHILGVNPDEIGIVGSEYPGYGVQLGVVTPEYLNELYNSADFVLMPSFNEGIGLGAIEAAGCGAIPVICADLSTREEFFPTSLFPEYLEVQPNPVSIANFIARFNQYDEWEDLQKRLLRHYNDNLKDKFDKVEVARKIIELYKTL